MSERRTEAATTEYRKRAHAKGDRPRSRVLLGTAALIAGLQMLEHVARGFASAWRGAFEQSVHAAGMGETPGELLIDGQVRRMLVAVLAPVAMVMMASFSGALLVGIAQEGGTQLHPSVLQWKGSKLNPIKKIGELFSWAHAGRVARASVPLAAIAVLGWMALEELTRSVAAANPIVLPHLLAVVFKAILNAAWVALIWSGVDYWMERVGWNKRIKMTKQEMKDERTRTEGNPRMKQALRQVRRETQ